MEYYGDTVCGYLHHVTQQQVLEFSGCFLNCLELQDSFCSFKDHDSWMVKLSRWAPTLTQVVDGHSSGGMRKAKGHTGTQMAPT